MGGGRAAQSGLYSPPPPWGRWHSWTKRGAHLGRGAGGLGTMTMSGKRLCSCINAHVSLHAGNLFVIVWVCGPLNKARVWALPRPSADNPTCSEGGREARRSPDPSFVRAVIKERDGRKSRRQTQKGPSKDAARLTRPKPPPPGRSPVSMGASCELCCRRFHAATFPLPVRFESQGGLHRTGGSETSPDGEALRADFCWGRIQPVLRGQTNHFLHRRRSSAA